MPGSQQHHNLVELYGADECVQTLKFVFNGKARLIHFLSSYTGRYQQGITDLCGFICTNRANAAAKHFLFAFHEQVRQLAMVGLGPLGHLNVRYQAQDSDDSYEDDM